MRKKQMMHKMRARNARPYNVAKKQPRIARPLFVQNFLFVQ